MEDTLGAGVDEGLSLEDTLDVDAGERLSLGVSPAVLGVEVEEMSLDVSPDRDLDSESTCKETPVSDVI